MSLRHYKTLRRSVFSLGTACIKVDNLFYCWSGEVWRINFVQIPDDDDVLELDLGVRLRERSVGHLDQ